MYDVGTDQNINYMIMELIEGESLADRLKRGPLSVADALTVGRAVASGLGEAHRRGIRVCIGGDYGFAWTPQGTNAKDIQTFVEMLGFSPMEAILAATKYGGEIMCMSDELGMIKEGYLADLLLVDGDPIADVRILQDKNRILAIMKDGKFHKAPRMNEARRRLTA